MGGGKLTGRDSTNVYNGNAQQTLGERDGGGRENRISIEISSLSHNNARSISQRKDLSAIRENQFIPSVGLVITKEDKIILSDDVVCANLIDIAKLCASARSGAVTAIKALPTPSSVGAFVQRGSVAGQGEARPFVHGDARECSF